MSLLASIVFLPMAHAKDSDGTCCNSAEKHLQANAQDIESKLGGLSEAVKELNDDADSIGAFGCRAAAENDYDLFLSRLKGKGLELPDFEHYKRATCGNSNVILQNTFASGSVTFFRSFIRGIYQKYGIEEVRKIVNFKDYTYKETLLDEALRWNGCMEDNPDNTATSQMIDILQKVGAKRSTSTCKPL